MCVKEREKEKERLGESPAAFVSLAMHFAKPKAQQLMHYFAGNHFALSEKAITHLGSNRDWQQTSPSHFLSNFQVEMKTRVVKG